MPSNLQGIEITDSDTSVYNYEIYKSGDNRARGVNIVPKEWEIGDPQIYWREPLYPFDGGLKQDRLPRVARLSNEHTRSRTYAKANIDASNDGLLIPPPLTTTKSLTAVATASVTFDSLQFFLCGRYMYTVDRSETVSVDKDFGSGKAGVSMAVFNNELIVAMGESEKIWKRDTSATWTQASDNTFAIALGVVGNKLWRAESTNKMSNCITTPLTLANWTPASPNQYAVGDTTYNVHTIIDYGGVPWAIKDDGAYAPDTNSQFFNQAPQMASWPHTENGKGAFVAQGYLWVPTVIGLLRISPGEALIRGPEKSNRPDFRFWVRGGVEWGDSIYLLVTDETQVSESFICKVDKDRYGLTEGQEYIYHEWCRLGSTDKGYTIGINAWPSGSRNTVTHDAGTMADLAGVGTITWGTTANATTSNNSYATAAAGISHYLRASNFGFSLDAASTILGILVSVERKTSTSTTNSAKNPANSIALSGIGNINWTAGSSGANVYGSITGTLGVSNVTGYLVFTNFSFALPSDATIVGITLSLYNSATFGSASGPVTDNIVKLYVGSQIVGDNKASATSRAADTTITYGSSTDTWGTTLTASQVNDTAFGFVYSMNIRNDWAIVVGETDGQACTMTIYYTTAGSIDNVVQLVNASATIVGDNKASASSWPTSDAVTTYGGSSDTWNASLTVTDINDTDFGFVLSVTTPTAITSSVDYVSVSVTYEDAIVTVSPTLFVGNGLDIQLIQLGFGAGRNIDDPNYRFGTSMEIETGLIQPAQNVTLVSGIIGVSLVGQIRSEDSFTLQYALGSASSYTNLLTTQEGSGTAAITGSDIYEQFTRYASPNTTGPYFKFKLTGTLAAGAGTDRSEIRALWAFGYTRPKVIDLIKAPIYCDRLAMHNGIPQGSTGGDTLRRFRAWKRDQTVFTLRFPDYEESRTVRARVFEVEGEEIISEKDSDGNSREVLVATVVFMRDDFAGAYGNA